MGATSYRVAIKPMVPGDKPDEKNFKDLESMPVRSIITNPANGAKLPAGTKEVPLRGAAWAGDHTVKQVDVSTDFGATWTAAKLGNPKNKYDWQRWTASVKLPSDGYYEIWTRGHRFARRHAAAYCRLLESAGLRRQSDASRGGAGRLMRARNARSRRTGGAAAFSCLHAALAAARRNQRATSRAAFHSARRKS